MRKEKYRLFTEENKQFLKAIREQLFSFGRLFPSPQGSSYYLGDDGTPWKDRPRETWITCRMAHVYSLATLLREKGQDTPAGAVSCEECRNLAWQALKGLLGELKDKQYGGWYAGVGADGTVVPGKQCYAHAFVILAATSLYLAGVEDAPVLLEEALRIYDRYFWDESEGLACDTWDTGFTCCDDYRGLNANMHSVEAFLAVYDTLHSPEYLRRAGRIIRHVIDWAKDAQWRIPEHFTKDWTPDPEKNREKPDDPFKPYGATPGHGIEWARLIVQWTAASGDLSQAEVSEYISAAENLYRRAVSDAWDCDGAPGIVYTTDWEGKPVVHDRMHWTLAEAINTSAVLLRVTGKQEYASEYAMFMEYLDQDVLDHRNGSWFHQLDRNNHLIGTVWPGKSDLYHAVQATLIPYNSQTGRSVAASLCDRNNPIEG